MPTCASSPPTDRRQHIIVLAVLLLAAVITRGLWIGDPLVGGDEQFYLLVGDRLWKGALPYVDIWDRKPIGLFLIYAALRPFSVDGIIAYQIGALVSATLTAFVIARISNRLVPLHVATMAGCLYLMWLPVVGGVGGQSPVFYNLLMAIAALLVIKAGVAPRDRALILGASALLLVGLAMQVKYSAIVEGVAFGSWLVIIRWRAEHRVGPLAGYAVILIFSAILPTFMAATFYVAIGHAETFFFTNFFSIFLKQTSAAETPNIAHNAVLVGPLLGGTVAAFAISATCKTLSPLKVFMAIWSIASIAGFFVIGHYYTHYALPMLVPLCIVCSLLLERLVGFAIIASFAVLFYVGTTGFPSTKRMEEDRAKANRMVEVLAPYTRHGCIYINDGPPILYLLTHSCLPTPYVFPEHLSLAAEASAINTRAAMADLIAGKPTAIVVRRAPDSWLRNAATDMMLVRTLEANYHLKTTIAASAPRDVLEIYGRNDLP